MKPHVLILGGGIAGLGAANWLVRNGFAVTVFEAKDRLGGRIHTIHEGTLPIELAAEFLHGEDKMIRGVINAAGLTTHLVPPNQQLMRDGKLKRVKVWDKMKKLIDRIDPRDADMSFQDFLTTQKLRESDHALAIGFVQGFHAAYPDRIGAHSIRRGEYAAEQMDGDSQGRINEGYSAMVGFLEREIRAHGGEILTSATVETIRWKPHRVEFQFQQDKHSKLIEGKAAVITLPLGVLKAKTVQFEPSLADKQEAIDQLYFGNVMKIILVFRERWWPKKMSFVQSLDEHIPVWWSDSRGNVLTGWAGGPKADALAHYSTAELRSLALETLGRIFPEQAQAAKEQLLAAHHHDWAHDPHVRGAYSYIPVNGLDLPKLLAAPMSETLFFAGEATTGDAQTGTVVGAYESGLRAAREITNARKPA